MLCWKGFSDGKYFGFAHKGSDDAIRGGGRYNSEADTQLQKFYGTTNPTSENEL